MSKNQSNLNNSKLLDQFSIWILFLWILTNLIYFSDIPISFSIFKLSINKAKWFRMDSSSVAMRLISDIADHPNVVVFPIPFTDLNVIKSFDSEILSIKWNIKILFIHLIYFKRTFIIVCLCSLLRDLSILIEYILHFILEVYIVWT